MDWQEVGLLKHSIPVRKCLDNKLKRTVIEVKSFFLDIRLKLDQCLL